jgi:hypothetical protein
MLHECDVKSRPKALSQRGSSPARAPKPSSKRPLARRSATAIGASSSAASRVTLDTLVRVAALTGHFRSTLMHAVIRLLPEC